VPDGLFGLEYTVGDKKAYRFFALEADRGTMPLARSNETQTSYMGKLTDYREIVGRQLYKSHLGVPNLFVLTVMTDATRLSRAVHLFAERGGGPLFLFRATRSLTAPSPRFLAEPWERPGLSSFSINE
jgi:hypothetical protein